MKRLVPFNLLFFAISLLVGQNSAVAQDVWVLDSTTVHVDIALDSSLIDGAWDVNWGPDNKLWFTDLEYVQRYDPISGIHDTLLQRSGENALGFAIHENLMNGTPYVFVAYDTSDYYAVGYEVYVYRYEYNAGQLVNPLLILTYEHAGEHAGGRMIITPDDKVMITTADYWFGGDVLKGRTLRLNFDGSVPMDNPIPGEYEYTSGHRNPQGLVQTPNGKIYNSEHGQAGNDEINLLVSGGHYGWPAYDGDVCIGLFPDSCSSTTYSYVSPLNTSTAPPSGVDYYNHPAIPEFSNSLLVGTLWGSLSLDVHALDANGDAVIDYHKYFDINGYGRIRDVAVAPDGSIYFIGFDRQDPTAIYHLYNPIGIGFEEQTSIDDLKVFPNPANDKVTIQWSAVDESLIMNLLDVDGKLIQSNRLEAGQTQFTFNIQDKAAGIYFVELKGVDGPPSRMKLVVK